MDLTVPGVEKNYLAGLKLALIGAVLTNLDAGKDKNSFILIVGEGQAGGDGLSRVLGGISKLKQV